MARLLCFLLPCVLSGGGGVVDAFSFRSPSRPQARVIAIADDARTPRNRLVSPTSSSKKIDQSNKVGLSLLSKSDDDAGSADEIDSLDSDLAREIEEALSLAQDAMQDAMQDAEVGAEDPQEDEIDAIANMLLEKPPTAPPPLPRPPEEEPSASVISLGLDDGADEEDIQPDPPSADSEPPSLTKSQVAFFAETLKEKSSANISLDLDESADEEDIQPTPPADSEPPSLTKSQVAFFAETLQEKLQKKAAKEIERLIKMIPGRQAELDEVEASTKQEEEIASVLKKEIEDSIQEREEMVKLIEEECSKERELLVAQMEIASDELKAAMDQSAEDITDAKSKTNKSREGLLSRLDSLKAAIDKVTMETIEIRSDTENIQRSKQSVLDKVIDEGKSKLAQFKKSFDIDFDYVKQNNAVLMRRADEAESMIRGAFDQINQMRTERVSLQQQILDQEKKSLGEIASLQRELELDGKRYAAAAKKERDRLDGVIDAAYQAYAIKVCKKITERQAIESDYKDKIRKVDMQITAAREKQEARVKEYLDKLEEKHKKERIAVYEEKVKAVSAIRKEMQAELAIENAKIEEIHEAMRPKIDAVTSQTAQLKADFEKEMTEKRQIAKEEEQEELRQIEDIREDMTDKIITQRRLYEEKKEAYLEDMNCKISDSDTELRQAWRDIAVIKKSSAEVRAKRDAMRDDVAEKQALISSYESDRKGFRKSLRLTAKVAREKIGSKTRRLLRRDKKKAQ
mmetsp:Transcript_34491/g.83462  ORF Transcript_34491/g.83462 Transcript_34491/m.83462 type:complete len:743 (-) Transcript_34491:45-2273(-)